MAIELEEVRRVQEVLKRVVSAGSGEEIPQELQTLPRERERIVRKLMGSEESDWRHLLSMSEGSDGELFEVWGLIHISAWETGSRSFGSFSKTADGKSVSSDQDLEDSLWIGASVLRAVAESVHAMVAELGMPPNRIVWGKDFESHVAFAEESTATLRRLYGRQEGAQEDVGSFTDDG